MSGETQSRHCWWLMLVVSLSQIADAGSGKAGHRRTVLSQLPEAMRVPSGLNATLFTVLVWPVSGLPTGWPVSASQTRTLLSKLPETKRIAHVGQPQQADVLCEIRSRRLAPR